MMTPGAGIFRTTLPQGFLSSGIHCGVKRYRPDLGLIYSEYDCVASGLFTTNSAKGAPVQYCEALLPRQDIRAILTNSGQANAATGKRGLKDNLTMVENLATVLGLETNQILTASTGVIGEPLSIKKIVSSLPTLKQKLTNLAEPFATAILTTDLVPKTVYKTVPLSQGTVTITGICKGSGMIHPNMATMLGYLLTDVKLNPTEAKHYLKKVTDKSFNMISVDGETSTNDSVFMLANGASQISIETKEDALVFEKALSDIAIALAKSIARDGEGAGKLIEITVKNSPSLALAKEIARSLTTSPLIKTAIAGNSPNWGRIISRLGAADIPVPTLRKLAIHCQEKLIYEKGAAYTRALEHLSEAMKDDTVKLVIDFNNGHEEATAWGCDLTEKYVQINSEYLS